MGKIGFFFLLGILYNYTLFGQAEFPKEFIAHVRLTSGLLTSPEYKPALFVGGLQIIPQYTIIQHVLRIGVAAGGSYADNKISGTAGPTLSLLLTELKGGAFGTLGNLHLSLEHLWGTDRQRLLGAGINLDLVNRVVIGLISYRDYNRNNWLVQPGLSYRISKVKNHEEGFLPKN